MSTSRRFLVQTEDGRRVAEIHYRSGMFFRMKGLLGRTQLVSGEGIWLKPCNSIHMFFMKFPIDVVFLDGAHKIVRLYPELRPWAISPVIFSAVSVVELASGEVGRHGLAVGQKLLFEPVSF